MGEIKELFPISVSYDGGGQRHPLPFTDEAVFCGVAHAYTAGGMFTPRTRFSGACFTGARVPAFSVPLRSPRPTGFRPGTELADIGMCSGVLSERESTCIAIDVHRFFQRNCGFFGVLYTLNGRLHSGVVAADIQRDCWGTVRARAFHSGFGSRDC